MGSILAVLGRGTGPRGEEMAGRFTGTDSQDLATILDPFRAIFVDLGPNRQMSAAKTGQVPAAETGHVSAVETRQMASVARTDFSVVSTHTVKV